MTPKEYFKDWTTVIPYDEFMRVTEWLRKQNPNYICPLPKNIFKAFTMCSLRDCKCIMTGQDPYPDMYKGKRRATGILFGNDSDIPEDNISPSLEVIKEACINYELPHQELIFDNTLESWARQGILMLNSSLTCKLGEPDSHMLYWMEFTSKLMINLSKHKTGLTYVLFGSRARSLGRYIDKVNNSIIEIEHPAYFARTKTKMPYNLFKAISKSIKDNYDTEIEWYQEYKPI